MCPAFSRLIQPEYAEANEGHPSSSYWVLLDTGSAENQFADPQIPLLMIEFHKRLIASEGHAVHCGCPINIDGVLSGSLLLGCVHLLRRYRGDLKITALA